MAACAIAKKSLWTLLRINILPGGQYDNKAVAAINFYPAFHLIEAKSLLLTTWEVNVYLGAVERPCSGLSVFCACLAAIWRLIVCHPSWDKGGIRVGWWQLS
jgi:hypothetical protein